MDPELEQRLAVQQEKVHGWRSFHGQRPFKCGHQFEPTRSCAGPAPGQAAGERGEGYPGPSACGAVVAATSERSCDCRVNDTKVASPRNPQRGDGMHATGYDL